MSITRAPVLRITVFALCVALVLAGAAGLSRAVTTRKRSAPPATVLAVRPAAVRRVTLESNGRHVELAHADGSWSAGAGASVVTVALMSDVEGGLLPLRAYRSLPADTSSPEYGLVDPEISLRVTDMDGQDHDVALGRPTFTNGGVYAERRGDPDRVYLVPRRMMDDLRSLVVGRRIDTTDDLAKKVQENTPKGDTTSWWLKQALDAGGTPPGERP
ncbi:MAG TPA: DUF4340 domain-containing protein [Acidimicrobiia bacterium]|nr:DUF4340 domain-containing protein [Acidimicrobiia bacterium]